MKTKSTTKTASGGDKNTVQKLSAAKGRALLEWYGKRAPKSIDWFPAQEKEVYGDVKAKNWNKLFWGDNKQVLAHLLKEYRGEVDLIYIDPPFDSKADYIKKVKINGQKVEGVEQSVIEEMQYTDMWEKDEYLQFMYERLLIMRELLADTGSIFLHCDWHKNAHLRLILDEIFGEENLRNEIVWHYHDKFATGGKSLDKNHDTIYHYSKSADFTGNQVRIQKEETTKRALRKKVDGKTVNLLDEDGNKIYAEYSDKVIDDVWDIGRTISKNEYIDYPTQKKEELLERVIRYGSNEGDLVLDCFVGSGTTCAVAQKLNRRWLGCDINKGSIISTTERLNRIIKEQTKENLFGKDFKGFTAFKVYNVNHYDVFNNDLQARQLLIETYRIDELSRGDFDGTLGQDYVKIISPNRVLSKLDIAEIIDAVKKNKDLFTVKTASKQKENTFENKVIVICSGAELDVRDFAKKENKTGVEIEIRDIQTDKKELDFKKPTEASISYTTKGKTVSIEVRDYYSPLLMKRLELENDGRLSMKERVNVFDYRQAIEHIVIDVNYGEGQKKADTSFNAEAFLHKEKKDELVETAYSHTYEKGGTYTVAVKIVDVLGEEYFETHEITVK